ncbi:hypothetical protein J4423_04380 [Candidatus Pacearchaeota archaeon]|nr:hypothetical protein [Candidatus Pacearchaeota archaeon]
MIKRGVSPVIATVLLLVLTIVIGGIIFSVVIPFVKDRLGESKMCLDVFEGVEFPESKFNCYSFSTSLNDSETGFSIKLNKEGISSFRVALTDDNGNSDVIDIKPEMNVRDDLRMVGSGSYNDSVGFPSVGGQRSYVIKNKYLKAEISPITESGEVCAVTDVIEFTSCYRDVIL